MTRRFSLRLLLGAVTLAALLLASWSALVEPYRRQSAAIDRLLKSQPQQLVLQQLVPQQIVTLMAGFDSTGVPCTYCDVIDGSWHEWVVSFALSGERAVKVRRIHLPDGTSEEDVLFLTKRMKFLEFIDMSDTDVTPDIARTIAALPELKEFVAIRSNFEDTSVKELSNSTTLRRVKLTSNPLGDASVTSFARMKELDELYVRWTKMTAKGVETLNAELPDCSIWFHARASTKTSNATSRSRGSSGYLPKLN